MMEEDRQVMSHGSWVIGHGSLVMGHESWVMGLKVAGLQVKGRRTANSELTFDL
jgi:hypothetical protein